MSDPLPGKVRPDGMVGVWQRLQEELGDVLFTLVNVARWCGIDPEAGLAGTNRRFLDRCSRVEASIGGDLQGRSIGELEGP